MTALSIVLPQIFHLTGIPEVGSVFLPMHIPVLLSGFLLGPVFGTIIGILSPAVNYLITGMPTLFRLPFMIGELMIYGLVSGLMFNTLKLKKIKFGEIISLITAMLAGRLFYAVMLLVATKFFKIECGGVIVAVNATVTGIYGIVLQFVTIPPIVYAIKNKTE